MTFEFKLPDIGEGVVEGEIVKWLVTVGDVVAVDQPLVEIMTDKATVVIPSPVAGIVTRLYGDEGDFVAVGAVLLEIGNGEHSQPQPLLGTDPIPADRDILKGTPTIPTEEWDSLAPGGACTRVLAAPATRRLARELDVAIEVVSGTGPAGRVTSEDIRRYHEHGGKTDGERLSAIAPKTAMVRSLDRDPNLRSGPALVGLDASDKVFPVRGVRRRIWDGMTRSAFSAPHFTFVEECEVSKLLTARQALNVFIAEDEPRLTFLPFIVKAVCVALRDFPELNGHVDEAQQAFIRRGNIHVGLAVAAEQGLTVPVIRYADRLSLKALAAQIRRFGEAVRTGGVTSSDLGGSTFTVTSLGREGGLFATPILNHPEVGILGVHRLQERLAQDGDGQLITNRFINLSLSCDHRLVDGHIAARFAYRVIELLSEPNQLYLEMS
ncbi:MAG: 2-oxo acid dehydrogenase subunit E2 [Myxococcales bacterium]|nr:2-oxo acid dehydrogenase subunit E2 [Myxococcales bacterium]